MHELHEVTRQRDALIETGAHFRAVVDQTIAGVFIVSDTGTVTYVNERFAQLFGYSAAEACGVPFIDFVHPDQRRAALESFRAVLEGQNRQSEFRICRRDGSTLDLLVHGSPATHGGRRSIVGVAVDVTERKRTEHELAASHRLLAETERIAGVGGWELDLATGISRCSEETCRLFQWDSGATLTLDDVYSRIHRDDVPIVKAAIAGAIARSGGYVCEYRVVLPDGTERILEARGEIQRDGMEQPITLRGTVRDVTETRRTTDAIRSLNRSLRLLTASNESLVREIDETALVTEVARLIVTVGGYSFAWIGFADEESALRPVARAGSSPGCDESIGILSGDSPLGQATRMVLSTGRLQVSRSLTRDHRLLPWRGDLLRCDLRASMTLPLRRDHATFGVLVVYSADENAFGDDERRLLVELADDLAYGIVSRRTAVEQGLASDRLRRAMESAVEAIAATLEARDPYTAGHQRRVAQLAAAIARELRLDEPVIQGIHFGALVHDVGKIKIPSELLSKPTRLSPLEARLLETHSEAGFDILKGIEFPWPVAQMVLQHHERLDGSGYPQGLTADQILLESRILAVADVVEAMASHRPYRPARGLETALAAIAEGRGTLYDADAVDACIRLFRERGFRLLLDE